MNKEDYFIEIIDFDDGFVKILYNSEEIQLKFAYQRGDMYFRSSINGVQNFAIRLFKIPSGYIMQCAGLVAEVSVHKQSEYELLKYMPERKDNNRPQFLLSPITGKITKLKIQENDVVEPGQHLLSIEAMKMDNAIIAENNAKIVKIYCQIGDNVQSGEKLVEFEYEN